MMLQSQGGQGGLTKPEAAQNHIRRTVYGLERLKVNRNLLNLALVCQNFTAIYDKTVWRTSCVELQTLLR